MALTLTESPVTITLMDETAILDEEKLKEAKQLQHLSKMYEKATIMAGPEKAEKMVSFIYTNAYAETAKRPDWAKLPDEDRLGDLGRRLTGLQLAKARLLKHGWTKNRAYTGPEQGSTRTGMCLGAALDLGPVYIDAGRYVADTVRGPEGNLCGGIPNWNDYKGRQFNEVIQLLDDCIHATLNELAEAV